MDLGPAQPIRECPTCGVDAARAMIVAATVAFYHPTYRCPHDGQFYGTLQAAANHAATHEPDLLKFVNAWVESTAKSEHLRIVRD